MHRRRLVPLLAVSVTATLAPVLATSTATAAAPPIAYASASAAEGTLDWYVQQKPRWKPCAADLPAALECATVKVPLDYRAPGGERLDLTMSRIKSTAPAERRGVLLVNPGGPGGPGLSMPLGLREVLPASVQRAYDLIGFDPRGVGRSSPLSCGLKPAEETLLRPYREERFGEDVAWARGVADKCERKAGDTLPYITTRNTARDMDLLRAVLGEKKISYLGYSYGTYLGSVYTQLFPGRTDRFVLDSGVDPARAWRGMMRWWAEGAEPAFDRWTEWAARRSEMYGLGDTPEKVDRTFWNLVARADEKPIEVEGRPTTGDDIRSRMRPAVFSPQWATAVVVELRKAAAGEPATAKRLTASTGSGSTGRAADAPKVPADNMTASSWAVVCGDNSAAWPRDPESYRRDALADRGRFPLFGDFVSSVKPCAFWGASVEPATRVNNRAGALIVQNEWDPQTPLPSGQALHAALKGSKMLTVLGGEGHGVYPNGTVCADGTVTGYLLTGTLPAKDVSCEATAGSNAEARENRERDALPGSPLPQRAPDRF
ncbi:alpha/beta hydrolase [Streptomyces sp. LP05-1]|uniref:Alpha/beta hydrolase n=1 Tax=Streptomyces pyxinae TaxID=2970734 RepID=A0ABT2CC02_9ACTN|nr:alpha/beta hydrolase [Streptomyces sp. LP05-1]MCS0634944.1 alpha/beta hydrolase [Streptomyces sp. LP05-1]